MSYRLVIAEKPSVGAAYAKVLGATNRQDGYWEGNGYLVSWCIGHLVELAPPNVYDEKYVKWSVADLPILPERWQYLVSASTKKQFGILKKLMNRPDVDSVTAATDAGREGELIFRLVYQQTGCKKPVFRLWLSSMEENAIREGFANLKPSTEYDALYNAALCRERADWMVGAFPAFFMPVWSATGGGPGHDPGACHDGGAGGRNCSIYPGKVLHRCHRICGRRYRIQQAVFAESRCRSSAHFLSKGGLCCVTGCRTQRKIRKSAAALRSHYAAAGRKPFTGVYGAADLELCAEPVRKKLITYPRTDSRFLTEDMAESLSGLASGTAAIFGAEEKLLVHVQQVINGSKVTDTTRCCLRQVWQGQTFLHCLPVK